jgi:hypothetical protein
MPVRVKKTRQNKNLEPRSDSIGTEKALGAVARGGLAAADHAVIAGFLAITISPDDGKAEAQQLTDRCRARRHAVLEPEIVEYRQLIRGKHDLQSFVSHVGHGRPQIRQLSKYLTPLSRLRFHGLPKTPQISKICK